MNAAEGEAEQVAEHGAVDVAREEVEHGEPNVAEQAAEQATDEKPSQQGRHGAWKRL